MDNCDEELEMHNRGPAPIRRGLGTAADAEQRRAHPAASTFIRCCGCRPELVELELGHEHQSQVVFSSRT